MLYAPICHILNAHLPFHYLLRTDRSFNFHLLTPGHHDLALLLTLLSMISMPLCPFSVSNFVVSFCLNSSRQIDVVCGTHCVSEEEI